MRKGRCSSCSSLVGGLLLLLLFSKSVFSLLFLVYLLRESMGNAQFHRYAPFCGTNLEIISFHRWCNFGTRQFLLLFTILRVNLMFWFNSSLRIRELVNWRQRYIFHRSNFEAFHFLALNRLLYTQFVHLFSDIIIVTHHWMLNAVKNYIFVVSFFLFIKLVTSMFCFGGFHFPYHLHYFHFLQWTK